MASPCRLLFCSRENVVRLAGDEALAVVLHRLAHTHLPLLHPSACSTCRVVAKVYLDTWGPYSPAGLRAAQPHKELASSESFGAHARVERL